MLEAEDGRAEPELVYLTKLLRVLTGATVGENNITEAKCQSCFGPVECAAMVLDEATPWNVKMPLLWFLYNSSIDTETKVESS